jgi:hypothetical protein
MNQSEAIPIKKKQLTAGERAAIVGSKRFGAVSRTLGGQFGVCRRLASKRYGRNFVKLDPWLRLMDEEGSG